MAPAASWEDTALNHVIMLWMVVLNNVKHTLPAAHGQTELILKREN